MSVLLLVYLLYWVPGYRRKPSLLCWVIGLTTILFASEQGWSESVPDAYKLREFLTRPAARTFEVKVANNGDKVVRKAQLSSL